MSNNSNSHYINEQLDKKLENLDVKLMTTKEIEDLVQKLLTEEIKKQNELIKMLKDLETKSLKDVLNSKVEIV